MGDVLNAKTIGLEAAGTVVAVAVATAAAAGVAACVAVVDRAGHLLSYARMDGAALFCGQLAQDKAYSAAMFGVATHEWWDRISEEPALVHGLPTAERLVIFGGGVPIVHSRQIVGAVGVSGGSADQDRAIAEAAARALRPVPVPRRPAASQKAGPQKAGPRRAARRT